MIAAGATTSALLALLGLALLVFLIGRRDIKPAGPAAPITPGAALAPAYGSAVLSAWEY
jgi:hypothetical protein